jgi:predicted PurR-regulated permease PerM
MGRSAGGSFGQHLLTASLSHDQSFEWVSLLIRRLTLSSPQRLPSGQLRWVRVKPLTLQIAKGLKVRSVTIEQRSSMAAPITRSALPDVFASAWASRILVLMLRALIILQPFTAEDAGSRLFLRRPPVRVQVLDMTNSDTETETASAVEPLAEMPLPADPKTIFLGGLFAFALLAVAYIAGEIVLPMVFAFTLKLLLQPFFRILERLHVPRVLAALLLILALFGTIVGLGTAISGPAGNWAAKLPEGIPRLEERLSFLRAPINTLQQFVQEVENIGATGARQGEAGPLGGAALITAVFAGTRSFASGLFTTVLFLYFLLVSGDTFLRRLVEILPRFSNKRQAVDISQQIESDISAYLLTITIMNAGVGIATALVMWLTGVGDPILWGTIAFLLNYAPILGPSLGVVMFLLAGLLTIDNLWQALLPAALYLAIHIVEGETVMPMLLARRFTLNPVLVILSLVFWFWMWGIPGAILSVPMLAIAKIVCDRVRPLAALGHFLAG